MAWSKYKNVQYGTVFPGSNLTDFPLLVKIAADSDIASECGSGGGIKFTSADGMTDLAFGLYPSSDITTGDIIARVKASPITSGTTGNPIVRLYYSASESTTEDKAGVMDGNYVLFMPLEEDPSTTDQYDWVTGTNLGVSSGSMTSGDLVDGQVGKGLDLDGSDDYIQTPAAYTIGLAGTFSVNVRRDGTGAGDEIFLSKSGDSGSARLRLDADLGNLRFAFGNTNSRDTGENLTTGQWYQVSMKWSSGADVAVFLDGVQVDSITTTSSFPTSSNYIRLGQYGVGGNNAFLGKLDEPQLSSLARSDDWLAYAYENDFNNSDTVTLGSEQGGGGGGAANSWYYNLIQAG